MCAPGGGDVDEKWTEFERKNTEKDRAKRKREKKPQRLEIFDSDQDSFSRLFVVWTREKRVQNGHENGREKAQKKKKEKKKSGKNFSGIRKTRFVKKKRQIKKGSRPLVRLADLTAE